MGRLLIARATGSGVAAEANLCKLLLAAFQLEKGHSTHLRANGRAVLEGVERREWIVGGPRRRPGLVQERRVLGGDQLVVGFGGRIEVALARNDVVLQQVARHDLLNVGGAFIGRHDVDDAAAAVHANDHRHRLLEGRESGDGGHGEYRDGRGGRGHDPGGLG